MEMEWTQATQLDQPWLRDADWAAAQGLWGYLEPLGERVVPLMLHKSKSEYHIGRNPNPTLNPPNDFLLPDARVSKFTSKLCTAGHRS